MPLQEAPRYFNHRDGGGAAQGPTGERQSISGIPVENIGEGSLVETHLSSAGLVQISSGKVADRYRAIGPDGQTVFLSARTDRKSAGDVRVAAIPKTGMVLTGIGAFWKRMMETHGMDTDLIAVPHPNFQAAREALPHQKVGHEIVWRSHNVVSPSDTGMWAHFERGVKDPYGIPFKEVDIPGPNRPFPSQVGRGGILFTPTTKEETEGAHDRPETEEEFVRDVDSKFGWGAAAAIIDKSYKVFMEGKAYAQSKGIILPDTKFEVAIIDGKVVFIDEMLTPDSSRFWEADSYESQLASGKNPVDKSKENLRVKVAEARKRQGLPSNKIPILTADDLAFVQEGYLSIYQRLVGQSLPSDCVDFDDRTVPVTDQGYMTAQISRFLNAHFQQNQ